MIVVKLVVSHHFPCRVPPLTKIGMLHSPSVIPNAVRELLKGKVGVYASLFSSAGLPLAQKVKFPVVWVDALPLNSSLTAFGMTLRVCIFC